MPVSETSSIIASDSLSAPAAGGGRDPAKSGERKRWRTLQNRIERARDLRRAGHQAEQAVWELLCTHPMGSLRFQRQHPIGPYFAAFACAARKLVIEIDGDHHAFQVEADPRRTQLMEQLGWRVVRFAANDVLTNPDGVWLQIDRLLNGRS